MSDKNPHPPESPEWQLFANMKTLEMSAASFMATATEFTQKANRAREKADAYRDALKKLAEK